MSVNTQDQTKRTVRALKAKAHRRASAEVHRHSEASPQKIATRGAIDQALIEFASQPVIAVTPDGVITAWNPAAERLYKYAAEEVIGENVAILVPADRLNEHLSIAARCLRNELIESYETVRLTKDGQKKDVSISIRPIAAPSGEVVELLKITRDISVQKQAEEKFRLAVESCPNGMVMVDRVGKIVLVNSEIERMFGYGRSELLGQSVDILVPDRVRERHIQYRHDFRRSPETRRMGAGRDLFARRKDGAEFPVEVGLNPINTHDGLFVLGVIVDISQRKQAEEMFHLAVEAYPAGVVIVDDRGRMVIVNEQVEKLFGYRRDELIGQAVDMLVPGRMRLHHTQLRGQFTARPETRSMGAGRDLFGVRKDGTEFPVEVGLNPIQTRDGLLILSVVVDISERKRMEGLRDDFVSTVSHELRTPLTSISASLALLANNADSELSQAAKRLVTIAHSNSTRLVRLVNDILDVEKIESGKLVFDFKKVEIRSLVEQTIEVNRALAENSGMTLRLEEGSGEYELVTDSDRFMQVLTNLLSNAVKFSPPGAEVLLRIEERNTFLRISVIDRGAGIPDDFKPRVFEKFAQADASNARQKGGTGLGLSIVKQIVLRLGGEVGFFDTPGGGTTFYIDLPMVETAPELVPQQLEEIGG